MRSRRLDINKNQFIFDCDVISFNYVKLLQIPDEELLRFFSELKSAGSVGDVYLSWIKYSADALNTRLSKY